MNPIPQNAPETGFTLIETIVTIMVLAIASAMMVSYFGTSVTQSSTPVVRLNTVAGINKVMQNITALYIRYAHWRPNTAYAANTIILPSPKNNNRFQYISSSSGTSGATEPGWPVTSGQSVIDGGVTWFYNGNAPTLAQLQTTIGAEGTEPDNTFGNYRVVQNRFIKFDAATNVEININGTPGDVQYGLYLKVSIGQILSAPDRTSETLTTLFAKR